MVESEQQETAPRGAMRRQPKVSPSTAAEEHGGGERAANKQPCPAPAVSRQLTVWCKSLVFHGDGYAVFDDADGRMVFRVDNYGVGGGGGGGGGSMALMDHAGRVLLTVRRRHRKMLSLAETWEVYKGDADADAAAAAAPPSLMMRAAKDLCSPSCTVSVLGVAGGDAPGVYHMSWSRREEWFRIYRSGAATNDEDALVAEVRRKRGGPGKATLLGKDVLSLVVQPGMDHAVAMAMLMISNSYR